MKRPGSVLAVLLLAALLLQLSLAVTASASCASAPTSANPYSFVGTVLSTSREGRIARVRTQAGALVEVDGTPGPAGTASDVDRTYQVGQRYEFAPSNGSSPYQDSICSGTVPRPVASIVERRALADPQAGRSSGPWLLLLLFVPVLVVLAALPTIRRRWGRGTSV
jgi:hypothetical protein